MPKMADPVSIIGTVVGVASLAIQVTETLHNYWMGVSNFQTQVEQILGLRDTTRGPHGGLEEGITGFEKTEDVESSQVAI